MKTDLIKKKWETVICTSGEECWCRIIQTMGTINYDLDGTIACSGDITKELAEHIVQIHNDWIDKNLA